MRRVLALPVALLLSLALAGTALAAFCGVTSKPGGAGQKVVLWVDLSTSPETVTVVSGTNAAGKFTGGFVDVHLDFDGDGTADCTIDDTFLISDHSGGIAPGQDFFGAPAAINPAVVNGIERGADPGGAEGVGEAEFACG